MAKSKFELLENLVDENKAEEYEFNNGGVIGFIVPDRNEELFGVWIKTPDSNKVKRVKNKNIVAKKNGFTVDGYVCTGDDFASFKNKADRILKAEEVKTESSDLTTLDVVQQKLVELGEEDGFDPFDGFDDEYKEDEGKEEKMKDESDVDVQPNVVPEKKVEMTANEYVDQLIAENQQKKASQIQLAAELAAAAAQKAAEEEANKVDLAKKAAVRSEHVQTNQNARIANNAVEIVNTLQGKVSTLNKELADERKQRDEDMDVLGAEIDRQDEVIQSQTTANAKLKTGLKYAGLAIALAAIAVAAVGSALHFISKDKNAVDAEAQAVVQAEKEANAKFNKVKGSGLLEYSADTSRETSKTPTGVKASVVNELENVSYQGVEKSAIEKFNAAYSENLGKLFGSAVAAELNSNSYSWLQENVLSFNEDGSLKKDSQGNLEVKDYAFESDFSKHVASAEDFEVSYEASFSVQLAKELAGNEITGGDSTNPGIQDPSDEEISTTINSVIWKDTVKNFLDKLDAKDTFANTDVRGIAIEDTTMYVQTDNRLYEFQLTDDFKQSFVNEEGNIIVGAESANAVMKSASLNEKYKSIEDVLKIAANPDKDGKVVIDSGYADSIRTNIQEKFGDDAQAFYKLSVGKDKTSTVQLKYVGSKDGKFASEGKKVELVGANSSNAKYAVVAALTERSLSNCTISKVEAVDKDVYSVTDLGNGYAFVAQDERTR